MKTWEFCNFAAEIILNQIMYYPRLIESQIALKMKTSGALIVAGPRFCGKTTTCMLFQKSFIKLNTKQSILMGRMNQKKPYFLVLDEMNLSYVERYFADFLSALESNQKIPLWEKPDECDSEVDASIALPKNLFIVGTINVGETTYWGLYMTDDHKTEAITRENAEQYNMPSSRRLPTRFSE